MNNITIAGVVFTEKELVVVLQSLLTEVEMLRLQLIAHDAVAGLLFLGRVSKRVAFENNDDFVAWVRSGMDGL